MAKTAVGPSSTTFKTFSSKSIVIPETPNNRQVFNNISDLNSVSTFNPNKRIEHIY